MGHNFHDDFICYFGGHWFLWVLIFILVFGYNSNYHFPYRGNATLTA